jgi:hypothetical protein
LGYQSTGKDPGYLSREGGAQFRENDLVGGACGQELSIGRPQRENDRRLTPQVSSSGLSRGPIHPHARVHNSHADVATQTVADRICCTMGPRDEPEDDKEAVLGIWCVISFRCRQGMAGREDRRLGLYCVPPALNVAAPVVIAVAVRHEAARFL